LPDGNWVAPASTDLVYFLHIPKTAGLSVNRFLTEAYPRDRICPAHSWDDLDLQRPHDLNRYKVFSGHWMDSLDSFLDRRIGTITLLRDPVQRTISHYAHLRRDPAQPYHELARRLSLREFCLHPETRHLVENYQSGYLGTRFDPREIAGRCQPSAAERLGITALAERSMLARSPDALLRAGGGRLVRCLAVGITERLGDTLTVFADTLGLRWGGETPYENSSYNRPRTIDPETIALIREMTSLDALLYRKAEALLDARLADLGDSQALDDEGLGSVRRVGGTMVPRPDRSGAAGRLYRRRKISPAKMRGLKLGLSEAIRRAPAGVRTASCWLYILYRVFTDRRIRPASRIPAALGLLYLFGPLNLLSATIADEIGAIVLGCVGSVALADKPLVAEFRCAARSRFAPD